MDEIFNELTLLADVVEQWGEHGAHAEVLATLIAEVEELRFAGDALASAVWAEADYTRSPMLSASRVALDAWEAARRA